MGPYAEERQRRQHRLSLETSSMLRNLLSAWWPWCDLPSWQGSGRNPSVGHVPSAQAPVSVGLGGRGRADFTLGPPCSVPSCLAGFKGLPPQAELTGSELQTLQALCRGHPAGTGPGWKTYSYSLNVKHVWPAELQPQTQSQPATLSPDRATCQVLPQHAAARWAWGSRAVPRPHPSEAGLAQMKSGALGKVQA